MQDLKQKLEQELKPLIEQEGLELVEVKVAGFGPVTTIRVYVDKAGGVSIEECARASRKISDYLDSADLIPHRYNLEVSSPGLDRPLTSRADFQRKQGEKVTLFMKDKSDPHEHLVGMITGLEGEELMLKTEAEEKKISLHLIEKALIAF
jgi:ribosome maturation factor RimP